LLAWRREYAYTVYYAMIERVAMKDPKITKHFHIKRELPSNRTRGLRKKPYIGVILRYLWVAGAPKIAAYQVRGILSQGYSVALLILAVSPRYKGEYNHLIKNVPYLIIRIPKFVERLELILSNFLFGKRRPGERAMPLLPFLLSIKYVKSFDVLLCHDPFSGLVGLIGKLLFGKPYIVYLHETPFGVTITRPLERTVLKHADVILTGSGKIARDIEAMGYKALSLPPGLPTDKREHIPKVNRILTVARWDRDRKPDWVIEVAKKLRHLTFLVLGYWQSKALYEEFIRKAQGLDNLIIYSHTVSENELNELMKTSSVIVRLNIGEHGIAMIAWEAVHRGIPVIVNSDLGVAEYIKAFNAGVVINEIKTSLIIEAIEKIKERYGEFVENCIKLGNQYSIGKQTESLLRVIYTML